MHSNNFYHLHLHSGNILLEEKSDTIKLTELENFVCNLPVKNEQYFNFIIDDLNYNSNNNSQKFHSHNNNNTNLFSDIFKGQFNIFEKIDIVSFGRIIYEMATGKELKSSFPDELELNDMDSEISDVLKIVFSRSLKNNRNNSNFKDTTIKDLLNMRLFVINDDKVNNEKDDSKKLFYFFIHFLDEVSRLHNDFSSENNKSNMENEEQQYCQFVKEKIFDQNNFLDKKNKLLNKF